jgi:hypothetical protein
VSDENPFRMSVWTWLAVLVSSLGVAGSLGYSTAQGLIACPLCIYQRAFMMAVSCILIVGGLLANVRPTWRLSLVALVAGVSGLGVAGWHVYLEAAGKLECPVGQFGLGTIPQQSLAAFVLLCLLLTLDVVSGPRASAGAESGSGVGALVPVVIIGVITAVGAVRSALPIPLTDDLKQGELRICRPPQPKS